MHDLHIWLYPYTVIRCLMRLWRVLFVISRARACGLQLLFAWCIVGITPAATAQVAAGTITGVVTDQAHATVPGATVTVTNVATNVRRVSTSTTDGVYSVPGLAPGTYRI